MARAGLDGERAEERAGKGVARAGGVVQFDDGIGGQGEESVGVEEVGAVFAFFDDDQARAFRAQGVAGADEVGFAGEEFGLGVVDDKEVEFAQEGESIRRGWF